MRISVFGKISRLPMEIGFSGIVSRRCVTLVWESFLHSMIPFHLIFLAAFMDQGFKQEISFMQLM